MTQTGTATQDAAKPPEAEPILVSQSDPGAPLLSILIHGAIIALLILGLPYFPKHAVPQAMAPIAISIVPDPDAQTEAPAAEPAASAPQAQAAAPQAEAPAEATPAPEAENTAPTDPSYNPFTTSLEVTENVSPQTLQAAPAQPAPIGDGAGTGQGQAQVAGTGSGSGSNGAGPSGGVPSRNAQPGRFDGDPLMHPQYLSVHLFGYVPIFFTEQLHEFLIHLIECGVVPIPAKDPNLSVEADVDFNPIGGVKSVRITNQGIFNEPAYQKASDALMGALSNPACSAIHLPVQYYPAWHQVHISFYQHVPE